MKECYICKKQQPIESFGKNQRMKDGHINKCDGCARVEQQVWRKNNPEKIKLQNKKRREANPMSRDEWKKYVSDKAIGKKASNNAYMHKRRLRTTRTMTELDVFAFQEADDLARMRGKMTNGLWNVDHIIPLKHKDVSGLHVHNNFQVVPKLWNEMKKNLNCDEFTYKGSL